MCLNVTIQNSKNGAKMKNEGSKTFSDFLSRGKIVCTTFVLL